MAAKTFDPVPVDQLYTIKREGVQKMRTSLLSCLHEDGALTSKAINTITVLRIYHQVARIIKYLDLMDRLEDKLYESIDSTLDNCDVTDNDTMFKLLQLQERLQKSMIESHKLLQPYMELQDMSIVDLMATANAADIESSSPINVMSPESRDKLRTAAKNVMDELSAPKNIESDESGGDADV